MNEDDTYRKLKQLPYQEVRDKVERISFMYTDTAWLKCFDELLIECGWTKDEWVEMFKIYPPLL